MPLDWDMTSDGLLDLTSPVVSLLSDSESASVISMCDSEGFSSSLGTSTSTLGVGMTLGVVGHVLIISVLDPSSISTDGPL